VCKLVSGGEEIDDALIDDLAIALQANIDAKKEQNHKLRVFNKGVERITDRLEALNGRTNRTHQEPNG